MAKNLLVIVGAGASNQLIPFDDRTSQYIGWENADLKPPLTRDVFRHDEHTRRILQDYDGARHLAAPIGLALSRGEQLEPLLRSYRDSDSQPLASQFLEIPLHLQDFFAEICEYTDQPTNYEMLVHTLFSASCGFHQIAFVTLNYETLLDNVLFPDYIGKPLNDNLDSYIGERCRLVKLHGSVNWARRLRKVFRLRDDFRGVRSYLSAIRSFGNAQSLSSALEPDIFHWYPGQPRLQEIRRDDTEVECYLYYPAISVPLGTYDRAFACPPPHLRGLEEFLPSCRNVLAIGTSARDDDLLEILAGGLTTVECFNIVDKDAEAVRSAMDGWCNVTPLGVYQEAHTGGFSDFIMHGGLQSFVEACKGD